MRRSKRELERAVTGLSGDTDTTDGAVLVVHVHPETGDWYADPEYTEPVDPAEADPVMLLEGGA